MVLCHLGMLNKMVIDYEEKNDYDKAAILKEFVLSISSSYSN